MNVETALLQDIREHPEDDTPRLVYADWVDEDGDPDRGEFIRLQCQIARAEQVPRRLLRREQVLFERHVSWWLGLIAPPSPIECILRRGFIEHITICSNNSLLLEQLPALDRYLAVRWLSIERAIDWSPGALEALLTAPGLHFLEDLTLRQWWPSSPAWHFLASLDFPRLRSFQLFGPYLSGEPLNVLVSAPWFRVLRRLAVRVDVPALADCPEVASLEELDLRGNNLRRPAFRALQASPYLKQLRRLKVDACDSDIAAELAAWLGSGFRVGERDDS